MQSSSLFNLSKRLATDMPPNTRESNSKQALSLTALVATGMPRLSWFTAWYIALTAIAYIVLLLFKSPYRPTTFTDWLFFGVALLPVAWLGDWASARNRRSLGAPRAASATTSMPSAASAHTIRPLFERATSQP
jgi:hypothetical protein